MDTKKKNILILGTYKDLSSLAIINNQLNNFLTLKGFNVFQSENGENLNQRENFDAVITHNWPPIFKLDNFNQSKKFIILPWEYQLVPPKWVSPLNQLFDKIWVPSSFVKNSLKNSNVLSDKISIIPNGFDPKIFKRGECTFFKNLTKKRVKFLFVGGTIWRKGIDILLEAYCSTFSKYDDVSLIIKDFGANSFYLKQNYRERIDEIINATNSPEIIYINKNLESEALAELYNFSTSLVSPYRGEGFCMPVLEAMACGKATVVPKGGATDDFCKEETSFFIETTNIRHRFKEFDLGDKKIDVTTPKVKSLALILYQIYNDTEKALEKGDTAFNFVHQKYSWEMIGEIYFQELKNTLE